MFVTRNTPTRHIIALGKCASPCFTVLAAVVTCLGFTGQRLLRLAIINTAIFSFGWRPPICPCLAPFATLPVDLCLAFICEPEFLLL